MVYVLFLIYYFKKNVLSLAFSLKDILQHFIFVNSCFRFFDVTNWLIDPFTILQITFRLKFWLEDQRPLRPMSNCGNKEMRHFFEAECFYWVKTGPPISDFDLHYCLHLTLPTLTETRMKLKTALLSVNIGVLLTVKASGNLIKMKIIWMME